MSERRVVGTPVRRPDLVEKVTGAATYCVDVALPGMLHAAVVRSDRAHARIRGIDATAAAAMPGVAAVVTAADLHDLTPRFGHAICDHEILAIEKVRFYGEPVALVVAGSLAEAVDAAAEVRVEYEDLPAVMTAAEALASGAPLVHDTGYPYAGDESFAGDTSAVREPSNICHETTMGWGDPDPAFAAAHAVVETTARFPMLYAYAMEPYNAVADYRGGSLEVWSTAQHPFMVRDDLARVFGLPLSRVIVRSPYIGGGYGSKSYTKVEPLAAVGSRAAGRPVKLVLDVEQSIHTTRADSAEVTVASAFDADGRLLARTVEILLDSGAYADNSPLVLTKAVNRCLGPYRIPNVRVRGRSVYTNTVPASSYRGFGAPQGALAGEMNMDQAAEALGLDPAEIRRRNLVKPGEEVLPGKRPMDADLPADLDLLVEALTGSKDGLLLTAEGDAAVGIGCSASDAGAYPVSTAAVRIHFDGSVTVLSGSAEMGQGSRSLLAQVAAEELGVPLERVTVAQSDTAVTPYERTTGASRTTTLAGLALQRACADARARVAALAEQLWGPPVEVIPGGVRSGEGIERTYSEVICGWFGTRAGDVTGSGAVRKADATALTPPFWEIGMVGATVDVDRETGQVRVNRLVTVADVGFAINPQAVEGQDLGAATQGLGAALFEELVYDGAQLVNPNVVDYRVPRASDMPQEIHALLVERGDGVGPYGAKGAGEGALNPIGPAVASAIRRAVGAWPTELPLTPERVWRLMNGFHDDE